MLMLLSPSKTLGDGTPPHPIVPTQPEWLDEATTLVQKARTLSPEDLQRMMAISPKLAALNHARYQSFTTPFTPHNATAALFTFQGDVYDGLAASSFTPDEIAFAQPRLRILSGLYGVLRPLDLMQPYRLEMGTALATKRGKNLYQFWGDRVSHSLNAAATAVQASAIVNLASEEYFKVVRPAVLQPRLITPVFHEVRNDKARVIGLMAKRARGRMAGWIIRHQLTNPDDLTSFSEDGYRYHAALSDHQQLVFRRQQS